VTVSGFKYKLIAIYILYGVCVKNICLDLCDPFWGCSILCSTRTPLTLYTSHTPYGRDLFVSHRLRQMSVPTLHTEYKWLILEEEEADYHVVLISHHCNFMPVSFLYSRILHFNHSSVGDGIPRFASLTCIPLF
jgi:hypothetical protein